MSLESSLNEIVTVIKDLFTIVFTGVATIIGFLTYRRARATVLQPIRTEVVKKQSAMLSELLAVVSQEEIFAFDYVDIVSVNIHSILIKYGFYFSKQEELEELLKSKRHAMIPCGEDNFLKDFTLSQPFDSEQDREKDEKENLEIKRKEYEKAKNDGIIIINSIIITNKHASFSEELGNFVANPFMPSSIQENLKDLLQTVHVNLTVHLKYTLEEFIREYIKRHVSGDKPNFSVGGVWNEFNHKRFHHREQFDEIKKAIREHLRIDERW
ncbi:MAG: hypothetical protein FVQ80_05420 [Planctomycetes bacterium]|nr:hypothetical protein [Planctomycetota bacterium]